MHMFIAFICIDQWRLLHKGYISQWLYLFLENYILNYACRTNRWLGNYLHDS